MLKSEASQHSLSTHTPRLIGEKTTRSRQRTSTSCTECRRRKQKCNQAKPSCNNCNRRYPPVVCSYAASSKASTSGGNLITLDVPSPSFENGAPLPLEVLDRFGQYRPRETTAPIPSSSVTSRSHSHFHTPRPRVYEVDESGQETAVQTPYLEIITPHSRKSSISNHSHASSAIDRPNDDHTYYPLPQAYRDSYFGVLPAHISISISPSEPYQALPLDASKRNLDLLHMFTHKLSHYMTSMDGQNSCTAFNNQWVPFMLQSPIFINVALLTAAYFQAVARGADVEKSVDVIGTRIKLISKINDQLTSKDKAVTEEAIAAVMSLAYNELIYSDKRSSLAHMRGLREMVRVYGGLDNIQFESLRKMLVRTDFQVACTFECPPFLHEDDLTAPLPPLTSYPLFLDSPLLESDTRFADSAATLGFSRECAAILDDMRFLTTSIIALNTSSTPLSPTSITLPELTKFLKTAIWIHDRLNSCRPPLNTPSKSVSAPPTDQFLPPIHTASLIFSLAISTRTPLSQACTPALLQLLWSQMWLIPLARWKTIPAIFHWLVLTIMPYARNKPEGRFLKGMVAAGTMAIGLVDWDVAKGAMVGMRRVQGWLEEGRRREGGRKKRVNGNGREKVDVVVRRDGDENEDNVVDVLAVDVEGCRTKSGKSRMGDTLQVPGLERDNDEDEEGESVSPRHRTPENVVKV